MLVNLSSRIQDEMCVWEINGLLYQLQFSIGLHFPYSVESIQSVPHFIWVAAIISAVAPKPVAVAGLPIIVDRSRHPLIVLLRYFVGPETTSYRGIESIHGRDTQ